MLNTNIIIIFIQSHIWFISPCYRTQYLKNSLICSLTLPSFRPNVCAEREVMLVAQRQPCVQAFTRMVKVWKQGCLGQNWCMGYERRWVLLLIQACIHSSIHPFFYPSIPLSIHSSIHPFLYPSIPLSIHSSIHPFLCPSFPLSIHSSIHPFLYPSIPLSIHSSIHPFLYTSIPLSIHSSIHPFFYPSIPLLNQIALYSSHAL
jgi:hypothetical protein